MVRLIFVRHDGRRGEPGEDAAIVAAQIGRREADRAAMRGDEAATWPTDAIGDCSLSEVALVAAGRRMPAVNACDHLDE